jgi:hypothetical protein
MVLFARVSIAFVVVKPLVVPTVYRHSSGEPNSIQGVHSAGQKRNSVAMGV